MNLIDELYEENVKQYILLRQVEVLLDPWIANPYSKLLVEKVIPVPLEGYNA